MTLIELTVLMIIYSFVYASGVLFEGFFGIFGYVIGFLFGYALLLVIGVIFFKIMGELDNSEDKEKTTLASGIKACIWFAGILFTLNAVSILIQNIYSFYGFIPNIICAFMVVILFVITAPFVSDVYSKIVKK